MKIRTKFKKLSAKFCFKKQDDALGSLELLTSFFVLLFLLSLFVDVLPMFVFKHNVNFVASELVRMAEVTGGTETDEVEERLEELENDLDIEFDSIDWTGTEYMESPNDTRVQINGKIKVTITTSYSIHGNKLSDANALDIVFPIVSTSTGRSEVYLKTP